MSNAMRKKDYSQYANQVFSKTCELDNCTLKNLLPFLETHNSRKK